MYMRGWRNTVEIDLSRLSIDISGILSRKTAVQARVPAWAFREKGGLAEGVFFVIRNAGFTANPEFREPGSSVGFGWHYLSNTTCLIQPHLFSVASLV